MNAIINYKPIDMVKTISATYLQRQIGSVIRRVYTDKEHIIVERDGLPVMAIVSIRDYEDFWAKFKSLKRSTNKP